MKRPIQAAGVLLLAFTAALGAQNKKTKPPNTPPPPRAEATRPPANNAAKNPAANGSAANPATRNPQAPKGRGGQRLGAPGNPVERLMSMSPKQRDRVLEKLPPQQQANLRKR